MNIKAYIDQFTEISHLKRDQQFVLLEKASNDACSKLKFLNFSLITFLIRTIFISLLSGGSYLLFGYSAWLLIVAVFLGLLFSTVAVTEINTHLLSKSLKEILLKQAQ
jgi:CHASE2 domain-containing sensor protein